MSNDFERKYDVSIDLAIEQQRDWVASYVNTTLRFLSINSPEHFLALTGNESKSPDDREQALKVSIEKWSSDLAKQIACFLRDEVDYRDHCGIETDSNSRPETVKIFVSKRVTYWMSRLLGLVALTDENIEGAFDTLLQDYQLVKSSTDVNLCLEKIGQGVSSKYHIEHSSLDWNLQLGLLACFKLWLCSVLQCGSRFSDAENRFSKLCRLHFDHGFQKRTGGRVKRTIERFVVLSDAISSTRFNHDIAKLPLSIRNTTSRKKITTKIAPVFRISIYILVRKPSAYLTDRYKLILLNRWIEVLFPELVTQQNSNSSLNKDYFLWLVSVFYRDVENRILDAKFNNAIMSYQSDICESEGFSYFGKQFSETLISNLHEHKDVVGRDETLLFSSLRGPLAEIGSDTSPFEQSQCSSKLLSLIDFLYSSAADVALAQTVKAAVEAKVGELRSISLLTNSIMCWEGNARYRWRAAHKTALISSLVNAHPNYVFRFHAWCAGINRSNIRLNIRNALAEEILVHEAAPEEALDTLLQKKFLGGKQ